MHVDLTSGNIHASLAYFQYTSLQGLATDTIRLLQLQPDADDQDIACTISPYRLSDALYYTAISYVCGLDDEDHWICLNNARLRVRPNLWRCLWRLRQHRQFGLIWIDAICISQQDPEERTHQVAFVGQIYSNASLVVAWLGENADGVVDVLESRGNHDTFKRFLRKGYVCTRTHNTEPICDQCSIRVSLWKALANVGRREYWTRLWIVQEIALAKHVVICIGNVVFAYNDYLVWIQFYPRLDYAPGRCISYNFVTVDPDKRRERIAECTAWQKLRDDIKPSVSTTALTLLAALSKEPDKKQCALGTLMMACAQLRCSDVRDKVFALLSMSIDFTELRPDYRKTPAEIYQQMIFISPKSGVLQKALFNLQEALQLTDEECRIA